MVFLVYVLMGHAGLVPRNAMNSGHFRKADFIAHSIERA